MLNWIIAGCIVIGGIVIGLIIRDKSSKYPLLNTKRKAQRQLWISPTKAIEVGSYHYCPLAEDKECRFQPSEQHQKLETTKKEHEPNLE